MQTIPKVYMTILLATILVVISIGLIVQDKEASNAVSFKNDVIEELQCSHFSSAVIDSCKSVGADLGYDTEITPISNGSGETIMCEVLIKYKYTVPVVGTQINQEVRGYAR